MWRFLGPRMGTMTIRTLHVKLLPSCPHQSSSFSILSPCRMAVASWLGAGALSALGGEPCVQVSSGHAVSLCLFYL